MRKEYAILVVIILVIVDIFLIKDVVNDSKVIKEKNNKKNSKEVIDSKEIPNEFLDDGIFKSYYNDAYNKLNSLSLDEKIGQLLLARYPGDGAIDDVKNYYLGGFVFFGNDFKDKTMDQVLKMISDVQDASDIPLLTAVDEEGGLVVRVSNNSNLAQSKFKSSRELYKVGGLDFIKEDTVHKSRVLKSLGINLNLAPVVDISTNPNDFMYERSLGENSEITSNYAKTVIEASRGSGVSYTLKHFPGYGNNVDTHTGSAVDNRSYDDIMNNDILPFKAGIESGAEAILVSHNIVNSIDKDNAASLSIKIHELLRSDLKFTGIIITDDLDMGAVSEIDDAVVKAIKAGNNLIITTDYKSDINKIKKAIKDKVISEDDIDKLVFRNLAWKYYKKI